MTAIIGGWDSEADLKVDGEVGLGPKVAGGKKEGGKYGGPFLYMIEPSGLYWVGVLFCSPCVCKIELIPFITGLLWRCDRQRPPVRQSGA
jgi:hypothetical protein